MARVGSATHRAIESILEVQDGVVRCPVQFANERRAR